MDGCVSLVFSSFLSASLPAGVKALLVSVFCGIPEEALRFAAASNCPDYSLPFGRVQASPAVIVANNPLVRDLHDHWVN